VAASFFAWKAHEGTLILRTNIRDVAVFVNDRKYTSRPGAVAIEIKLPPDIYQIRAVHPGYTDFGPVAAAVKTGGDTALDLELNPKPAMLRIRGAEPGTAIKVDGVLVGSAAPGPELTGQLSPGPHAVELSRAGYLPKKIVLQLAPGEDHLLSGSDVELHSTDASLRSPEPPGLAIESGAYADVLPAVEVRRQPQTPSQPAPEPDSEAIVALIGRFANAWSAKDMDSILAIERDLDRQTLKSQFAPVKEIAMKISPLSPPQVRGTQATVVCRRQADETLLDGSRKQNPESVITYVLSKETGGWHIDGTH
jgi:hypothetical protein